MIGRRMQRLAVGRLSRQRGLTLPETAAALIGLAIFILSILAVHVERMSTSTSSVLRLDAEKLARELAQQVQGNRQSDVRYENAIGVVCKADANNLNPQQQALRQVACWQEKVSAALPSGMGAISLDEEAAPPAYVITVSWSQPGARTASYLLRIDAGFTAAARSAARAAN